MSFVPEGHILLAYTLACLVLFVTPGPDMSLFLSKTLAHGRAAGIAAMAGTSVGCCLHTLLAALGLSALIAASAPAFAVLRIVGAVYLLWLAFAAIRNGSALTVKGERRGVAPLGRTFVVGLGVNLTNPKIVLFFVTFLPQFVTAGDPDVAGKLLFLGLYFVALSIPLSALLILGAEHAIGILTRRPRVMRAIDYVFAGVFGLFALKIATTTSR